MKKLTVLLALSTIGLAALCVVQWRKLAEQRVQTAALQGEAVEQSERVTSLEAAKNRAESQRHQLLDQTEELAAQLRARQTAESNTVVATPTNPPPATAEPAKGDKAGLGKMLAKMMEDPDTKKFIRDQQRVMLDQLYAPLVKQMGLNPEEAAGFKDLLADNMLKAAEKASSLFGGSSATNRAAAMETMSAEQKSFDDQLKAFLGDTRYAQYKDYQETVGERTQLNLFKQQTGAHLGLSDQQTDQLLSFMKEEKKNVAATGGQPLSGAGQDQAGLQAMLSEEQGQKLIQSQETVNQRVYERAQAMLSPEQLDAFARFQTNQLQMMRMGMSMARKMFAPETSEGAATTGQ